MNKKKITAVLLAAVLCFSCAAAGEKQNIKSGKQDKIINILCYHRFKKRNITDEKKKKWGDIYYISPKMLEKHIKYIRKNNTIISMNRYLRFLDGKADIPGRSVLITIDDGYRSIYTRAFPVLKRLNVPFTVYYYQYFLPGGANALNRSMIKEMMRAGAEAGCHSNTHPILTSRWKNRHSKNKRKMGDEEYIEFLKDEIISSKKYLEEYIGVPMATFAYPYGTYSDEVVHFIKKAGYKAAFSVVASCNTQKTNRYRLKRTMIYNSTDVEKLKEILSKKPLEVESICPGDGDILEDKTPKITAVLSGDSKINTATVRLMMGRVGLTGSEYNPITKKVTYAYEKELPGGTHIARVKAEGVNGGDFEYAWLFITGKPTKMTLLKGEGNNIAKEVKERAKNK